MERAGLCGNYQESFQSPVPAQIPVLMLQACDWPRRFSVYFIGLSVVYFMETLFPSTETHAWKHWSVKTCQPEAPSKTVRGEHLRWARPAPAAPVSLQTDGETTLQRMQAGCIWKRC